MTCNAPSNPNSEIIFNADCDGTWVMKLTTKGIFFNRDTFQNSSPDAFGLAVIQILEKSFSVKFEKIEPPYDK